MISRRGGVRLTMADGAGNGTSTADWRDTNEG